MFKRGVTGMALFVSFVGFKGGTGKTVLCFQMAERAMAAGFNVCVLDLDPEGSMMRHRGWRSDRGLPMWPIQPWNVRQPPGERLFDGIVDQYDIVFCDFAGFNTRHTYAYLDRMDLLLAPVSNSGQDQTVTTPMGFLARRRGWNLHFVINNVAISSPLTRSLLADLREADFQFCPVLISRWNGLVLSSMWGYGICEYDPESRGAQQVVRMWEWLDGALAELVQSRLAAAV